MTYNGQQFDGITQQYYLRARFYNPVIGRFTQEDVYRGDGLNLYSYCGSNPVGYCDPSGYAKRECPPSKTQAINDTNMEGKTEVIGELEYIHYLKKNKVTDIDELQTQVKGQIDGFNRIIQEEGMTGLKNRVNNYGPKLEADGRKYVKSLGSTPSGKAYLHEPDMKAGGLPTDVSITGDRRNNSIIGGQAGMISREILNMSDDVIGVTGKLKLIGVK
ncbi:RHS repeat-associated core domain-containing protein [Clostridium estertheticum]|uniref:RHS repeat-associated core domain-containing protein n=1 Tax=Clostridium estertheticum TaxID=238834 RepID=UPI00311AAF66